MNTHNFNKLRLLQVVDSILLIALLGFIALLTWVSLTNLTSRTHQSLLESTDLLQNAHNAFTHQVALEKMVSQHHLTLDQLNSELLKAAFTPDNTTDIVRTSQTLAKQLDEQQHDLLKFWPNNANPQLRSDYGHSIGAIIKLAEKLKEIPPEQWRQTAIDARADIMQAHQSMNEIKGLNDNLGYNFSENVQLSIQHAVDNTQQMENRLGLIKQQALWGMITIMLLLLVSRLFFSSRFSKLLQSARNAQQIAEEAVKTKARFLATMSHEIRTPMNGVIGMTRLLMNTPMSKKQTEFVESIRLSGDHLLTVINDVLDFSKIEAGKLDLKREAFDLCSCIEDILNLLNAKALEKNLELAYAVDPSIPLFIEGDMVRLRQVLTNLIGNAIKFTDQGEVTIFVMPRNQDSNGLELEFQINDTGPGIPGDRIETIFEQFSRADDKQVQRHEGTGLGLAISRHLIEMMQGKIWVESTLGVGSRFHFTIKTRAAKGPDKPFLQDNIPAIVGKRILIAENNPASCQTLTDFCQGWGAAVDAVYTATDAIGRITGDKRYDIVLVESNLPGDAPLELGKHIRQCYSKQELQLILIAPPNDRHPKETVRELYNLYLTKPITRSRLFDSLMTVLGEASLMPAKPEQSLLKLGERLPLTILLAEDNQINQIVATTILDEMAYKADVVETGLQVLDTLHKQPYQVVFMDMQMPELDGLEATRRIRAEFPPERQPVIIAMTANAMEGDRQECLDAGMNDYISKPVLPEAVEAALQRCFQASPHQPAPEQAYETVSA